MAEVPHMQKDEPPISTTATPTTSSILQQRKEERPEETTPTPGGLIISSANEPSTKKSDEPVGMVLTVETKKTIETLVVGPTAPAETTATTSSGTNTGSGGGGGPTSSSVARGGGPTTTTTAGTGSGAQATTQTASATIPMIEIGVNLDDDPRKHHFLSTFFTVLAFCFSFGVMTVGAFADFSSSLKSNTTFAALYLVTTFLAVLLYMSLMSAIENDTEKHSYLLGIICLQVLSIVWICVCIGTLGRFADAAPGLMVYDVFALVICILAMSFTTWYYVLLTKYRRPTIKFEYQKSGAEMAELFFTALTLNFTIMLAQVYAVSGENAYLNAVVAFSVLLLISSLLQLIFSLLNYLENRDYTWAPSLLGTSIGTFICATIVFPLLGHLWSTNASTNNAIPGIALGAWLCSLIQVFIACYVCGYRLSQSDTSNRRRGTSSSAAATTGGGGDGTATTTASTTNAPGDIEKQQHRPEQQQHHLAAV